MNHSLIRILSRYTAIDEDRHHYDLDGFPDLESYFIPKKIQGKRCKAKSTIDTKKNLAKKEERKKHKNI